MTTSASPPPSLQSTPRAAQLPTNAATHQRLTPIPEGKAPLRGTDKVPGEPQQVTELNNQSVIDTLLLYEELPQISFSLLKRKLPIHLAKITDLHHSGDNVCNKPRSWADWQMIPDSI